MEKSIEATFSSTKFQYLGDDGNVYDTLALLHAAGTQPWPNLPQNLPAHLVAVCRVANADTAGSAFRIRTDSDDVPTQGLLVLSGVTLSMPGESWTDKIPIDSVIIKQSGATDVINLTVIF